MVDVEGIQRLLKRNSERRTAEIAALRAAGDQDGLDQLLKVVHCPQEVDAGDATDAWVSYWPKANYDWRLRAWLRDNLTGKFCLAWARSADPDYELRFERSEDAFAFKIRWA